MHRSWLRERVVAIYIFATSLLSERLLRYSWQKVFWKVLSSLPQGKICKSVEKNFYLVFMQSLIDMMQMFSMIHRWPSFSGPPNTLGLIVSGETSAIFSLVPRRSLLPRCSREVWEKAEERVSLADVTSHEQRTPWAEAELFSADPCQYCCYCRRCYCWWCVLCFWGRAKSQGRFVTRYLGISIKRV